MPLLVAASPPLVQDSSAAWQQSVKYDIAVTLDDVAHELNGTIRIEYTNHSPAALPFIWMHLYPNAYSSDQSAFAQQQLENRNTDFYYAPKKQRGYIDQLQFKTEQGSPLTLTYDPKTPILPA
ncbi:MAG: hypothetical protein IPL33_08545 [Sphingobacteriales bacterium]|nr:hypothetical protein [Sphingobacteriales bacterium]